MPYRHPCTMPIQELWKCRKSRVSGLESEAINPQIPPQQHTFSRKATPPKDSILPPLNSTNQEPSVQVHEAVGVHFQVPQKGMSC